MGNQCVVKSLLQCPADFLFPCCTKGPLLDLIFRDTPCRMLMGVLVKDNAQISYNNRGVEA